MANQERAKFWRDTTLGGLELLRASYITHAFAPHTHEGFAIGVIEAGAEGFSYRRSYHVAPAGTMVVINPGERHTGEAAARTGWTYRMLYPEARLLQRA
ncbi:MAG: AraC family ligand binding domain-containing protein, partial [Bacteroidota bacterium]